MPRQQISELPLLAGIISSADIAEILFLMKFSTFGRALLAKGVWFSPALTHLGSSFVHLGRTSKDLFAVQKSLSWA